MSDQTARSGKDILAQIQGQPARRGVAHICMNPGLIDQWNDANDDLVQSKAEDSSSDRLAAGSASAKTKNLAQKVQDLETEIEAADVAYTFEKVDKTRFSEICDSHPAREGNLMDYNVGYNRDAVDTALAQACLVDPVFELCQIKGCTHKECGSWQALLAFISPGDWNEMVAVVREVNEAVTGRPKSVLASQVLARAGSGSRRRAPGA